MIDRYERWLTAAWAPLSVRLAPYTVTTVGTLKRKGSMWIKL